MSKTQRSGTSAASTFTHTTSLVKSAPPTNNASTAARRAWTSSSLRLRGAPNGSPWTRSNSSLVGERCLTNVSWQCHSAQASPMSGALLRTYMIGQRLDSFGSGNPVSCETSMDLPLPLGPRTTTSGGSRVSGSLYNVHSARLPGFPKQRRWRDVPRINKFTHTLT